MKFDPKAVHPGEIPEEGLRISGEIEEDIFQLEDKTVQPVGPVRYEGHLSNITGSILFLGALSSDFQLECIRCLEPFIARVSLEGHGLQTEIESSDTIDLTELIREDILLALPPHPRCEEGVSERRCPAEGKFLTSDSYKPVDEESSTGSSAWEGLDDLTENKD